MLKSLYGMIPLKVFRIMNSKTDSNSTGSGKFIENYQRFENG